MSTVLDLSKLSAAELADLQIKLADEAAYRERVEAMAADLERDLERLSAVVAGRPALPFAPVPVWGTGKLVGHPPGQCVVFENERYVNMGARFLASEPGSTDDWMHVVERPDPDPEPDVPLTPLEPAEPLEPSPEQLPSLGERSRHEHSH